MGDLAKNRFNDKYKRLKVPKPSVSKLTKKGKPIDTLEPTIEDGTGVALEKACGRLLAKLAKFMEDRMSPTTSSEAPSNSPNNTRKVSKVNRTRKRKAKIL